MGQQKLFLGDRELYSEGKRRKIELLAVWFVLGDIPKYTQNIWKKKPRVVGDFFSIEEKRD
jgi:hypothetical protein